MFSSLKKFFTTNLGVERAYDDVFDSAAYNEAEILRDVTGRYNLFHKHGDLIQSYARKADAERGAKRRGLSVY